MSADPDTRTVSVDGPAADAAWEEFLADIETANPALRDSPGVSISTDTLRQMLRTAFYVGFESGTSNALSKNRP